MAEDDRLLRKAFVGGLSWLTTEESLKDYFESQGHPVERTMIMKDKGSGRSRGFGFVIFQTVESVHSVATIHTIEGRQVEVKPAVSKQEMATKIKKIFCGGVPLSLSETEFREYFEKFGSITDVQIVKDRNTGKSRGFGFVRFQDPSSVKKVMKEKHFLLNKLIEVKKAEPKNALLNEAEAAGLAEGSWANSTRGGVGGATGTAGGTSGRPPSGGPIGSMNPGMVGVPVVPVPRMVLPHGGAGGAGEDGKQEGGDGENGGGAGASGGGFPSVGDHASPVFYTYPVGFSSNQYAGSLYGAPSYPPVYGYPQVYSQVNQTYPVPPPYVNALGMPSMPWQPPYYYPSSEPGIDMQHVPPELMLPTGEQMLAGTGGAGDGNGHANNNGGGAKPPPEIIEPNNNTLKVLATLTTQSSPARFPQRHSAPLKSFTIQQEIEELPTVLEEKQQSPLPLPSSRLGGTASPKPTLSSYSVYSNSNSTDGSPAVYKSMRTGVVVPPPTIVEPTSSSSVNTNLLHPNGMKQLRNSSLFSESHDSVLRVRKSNFNLSKSSPGTAMVRSADVSIEEIGSPTLRPLSSFWGSTIK